MVKYEPFDDALHQFNLLEQAHSQDNLHKKFLSLKKDAHSICSGDSPFRLNPRSDFSFQVHLVLSGKELGTLNVRFNERPDRIWMMLDSRGETTEISVHETSEGLLYAKVDGENPFGVADDFLDDYYMKSILTYLLEYVTRNLEQTKLEVEA